MAQQPIPQSRPIVAEAAAAAGRDPSEIRTIVNFPGRITERTLPAPRDRDNRWIGWFGRSGVEELTSPVLEHGAAGFTLFTSDHGAPVPIVLGRWASEIAPAVREAVAKEQRSYEPVPFGITTAVESADMELSEAG